MWVWAWAHTPYHDAHADSGEADLVDGLLGAPHADGRNRREKELQDGEWVCRRWVVVVRVCTCVRALRDGVSVGGHTVVHDTTILG